MSLIRFVKWSLKLRHIFAWNWSACTKRMSWFHHNMQMQQNATPCVNCRFSYCDITTHVTLSHMLRCMLHGPLSGPPVRSGRWLTMSQCSRRTILHSYHIKQCRASLRIFEVDNLHTVGSFLGNFSRKHMHCVPDAVAKHTAALAAVCLHIKFYTGGCNELENDFSTTLWNRSGR